MIKLVLHLSRIVFRILGALAWNVCVCLCAYVLVCAGVYIIILIRQKTKTINRKS